MFEHKSPEMRLNATATALVFTDLHNDFLSPQGKAFPLIKDSLVRNNTAENIERLLRAARTAGLKVFISPHYYYPHDHKWVAPTTPLEDLAHQIGLLNRRDPLTAEDLEGSGADFPERYKPFVRHADTIVTSPHKAYGTSPNDMILQLRRYRIEKIVLGGPVGNLCVEAHLRDFIEHGFEVAMVRDATAGAANEEGDGYHAAMINWRFLAHALWTTAEAVKRIEATMGSRQSSAAAARSA